MAGRLILASRSPQRRAILEQLGIEFEVVPADVEEVESADSPRDLVVENAGRKTRSIAARAAPDRRVLGADTAVVLGGRVYGKPRDDREARVFLTALAGREHEVWSGIALSGPNEDPSAPRLRATAAVTGVRFRPLGASDLDWYLGTGEWRDRAGAYAIQGRGAALVERVTGDFWNVVGLPVAELLRLEPEILTR